LENPQASYYCARYYDPNAGRFASEDTIGFDGGINFYQYAQSNPVMFTDPKGLSPCLKACLKIYYGFTRDAGVILAVSAPVIPKTITLGGGTGATSLCSLALRKLLPMRVPGGILAPTIGNVAARTPVVGAALARWIPIAGLILTGIDAYGISDCTSQCKRDNWFPPCSTCSQ